MSAERVSAGIELAFDVDTQQRIRALWASLADLGLATLASHTHRQHRPHLTVVVADWLEVAAVRHAAAAVEWPGRLPVRFSFVGHFETGPFWLGVVVTRELIDLHRAFHNALGAARIASQPHYLPGNWTPHSTLAMRVADDQLAPASALALAALPISGHVVAADLVRHTTTAAEYIPLNR